MNFKIVNQFLVFALALCTAFLSFGGNESDLMQSANSRLIKVNQISCSSFEHQTINEANSNQQPIEFLKKIEESEDDECIDTDSTSSFGIVDSNNVDYTFFTTTFFIESKKLGQQSCPIYIRIHSLII